LALCLWLKFSKTPGYAMWGGFCDQDHHRWLTTQYDDLVDLSISRVHRHPRCRRSDGIAMPSVWWNDLRQWPSIIRYLHDAPVKIGLQGEDAADLATFQGKVMTAHDARLATGSVQGTAFALILCDVDEMNQATCMGNLWLTRTVVCGRPHILSRLDPVAGAAIEPLGRDRARRLSGLKADTGD
jgi:hypothetical protein